MSTLSGATISRIFAITPVLALLLAPSPFALAQPRVGGTLTAVLVSEPRALDGTSGAWQEGFVAAQLFNSLLVQDANLNIVPSLAERWETNAQEGTYTFKLRRGVQWHDAKPLTVQDVKFTFETLLPKVDTFGTLYFKDTTVTIVDDTTVKIKPGSFLPGVQQLLFASANGFIYPKHILEGQEFLKSEFRQKPVGTGPFKFQEWVKGSHIIFVKNDNYWVKGKPFLDRILVRIISDPAAILAGFQRGELDYIFRGLPFEAVSTLRADPELDVLTPELPPYRTSLWLNIERVKDARVRQAIFYAIDTREVAQKATLGIAPVTDTLYVPQVAPQTPNKVAYTYDPARAERLLDEAGFKRGADGKRVTIEFLNRRGEPEELLATELIRDQLSKVGIEVKVKTVDFGTYLDLMSKYQYDMLIVKRWIPPFWSYQLFHSKWIVGRAFTNTFQYRNAEVDSLFDQWLKEVDPAKAREQLQRIEAILSRDLPEIRMYQTIWLNVKRKTFEGEGLPVGRYIFADSLENVYWTKGTPVAQPQAAAPAQAPTDFTTIGIAVAIAAVIVVAVVAVVMRRR